MRGCFLACLVCDLPPAAPGFFLTSLLGRFDFKKKADSQYFSLHKIWDYARLRIVVVVVVLLVVTFRRTTAILIVIERGKLHRLVFLEIFFRR